MNYRHIYHAGNFADVVKHVVLTRVIEHLKRKDGAFRVVDTHAGIGSYDLGSDAARRTGEWRGGIGRLLGPGAAALPKPVADLLAPYLDAVRAANPAGDLVRYPGSPRIARTLMRAQDHLIVNELHPQDLVSLRGAFARDKQAQVMALDGWIALKAVLPPPERRGVILVDPPFEAEGELDRLVKALTDGTSRFATGTYLLWYPIKNPIELRNFKRRLEATGLPRLACLELFVREPQQVAQLNGSGLVILNPTFGLDNELSKLMPHLTQLLAVEGRGRWLLDWIRRE